MSETQLIDYAMIKLSKTGDTGLCTGMPYLDICENHEALVLIQTVCKNFGKFTERQVNRAIAARNMQARMAHPTDESFKQMVGRKILDNCSIVASDTRL